MTAVRNYDLELTDHAVRQQKAGDKIRKQEEKMRGGGARRRSEQQRLMNALRCNKAALDFNRALFDFDAEGSAFRLKP